VGISSDCPIFSGTPIIPGTGKATQFKFGQYIQRVHPNPLNVRHNGVHSYAIVALRSKKLNFLGETGIGRIQGLPNFGGTPYYLRNGKSYGFQIWPVHSEGPCEQKSIKNFREKGAWAYPGTANFFGYPQLSQDRTCKAKLRNSNFACAFIGSIGTKPIKNFGKSSRGRRQGLPKIFRAPNTHGASRGHLCDSSAFLFITSTLNMHRAT